MLRVILLALTLISVDALAAQPLSQGEAINVAGRQRMLSQRITQLYLLQGIKPESDKYRSKMIKHIDEFQTNLERLAATQAAGPIQHELLEVNKLWQPFQTIALSEVSKESSIELIEKSNVLLVEAHDYVTKLQKLTKHSSAELVNVAGRQRMLSQRIAKNFLANHWGVGNDTTRERFYEDLAEYEHMLQYLKNSEFNTNEITRKLMKTEGHFKYASKGFDGEMSMNNDRLIFVITGTTDIMLGNMNEITQLYAKLVDS